MKFVILCAIALLMVLISTLVVMAQRATQKPSHRAMARAKCRPLTLMERMAVPFVLAMEPLRPSNWLPGSNRLILANTVEVRSGSGETKYSDAAIGRYTIVKQGSDENHIAICGAADIPLGSTTDDSATAAEKPVYFELFGLVKRQLEATASGAIVAGDWLVPAADGKLRKLPLVAGTYYICGRARTAAADGKQVVYVPCIPIQRVVA